MINHDGNRGNLDELSLRASDDAQRDYLHRILSQPGLALAATGVPVIGFTLVQAAGSGDLEPLSAAPPMIAKAGGSSASAMAF